MTSRTRCTRFIRSAFEADGGTFDNLAFVRELASNMSVEIGKLDL